MKNTAQNTSEKQWDIIAKEESANDRFELKVRVYTLLAVAGWLVFSIPHMRVLYYLIFIAAFISFGFIPIIWGADKKQKILSYIFLHFLDAALLTYLLIFPNPFLESSHPVQLNLRFHNFLYFFILLGAAAFSFSPIRMLWAGFSCAIMWSAGVAWIFSRDDTVLSTDKNLADLDEFLSPYYLSVLQWMNEVALMLIVTVMLSFAVVRSRRLLIGKVEATQAKRNLARHFPSEIVEHLANSPSAFDEPQQKRATILVVDILSFTEITEQASPQDIFSFVRTFHGLMNEVIFRHGGTVDKYLGDGVLAIFGAPVSGSRDAGNAIRCACKMIEAVENWNSSRNILENITVKIGIGVHEGIVMIGNIGNEQRLEFAIIGDTVNVANRLERLTRELGVEVVVSEAAILAAKNEDPKIEDVLSAFSELETCKVRGRKGDIRIRCLGLPSSNDALRKTSRL